MQRNRSEIAELPPFDPLDPSIRDDPYPHYAQFRESRPVHLGLPPLPSLPRCHYVFRHADVAAILEDDRFGRERLKGGSGASSPLGAGSTVIRSVVRRMLLFADPPRHTRLRGLMEAAFSPRIHAAARQRADEVAPLLLEETLATPAPDLIVGLAIPLPVLVMSEVLGVPREDRLRIRQWSSEIVALTDLRSGEDVLERATRSTAEVVDYLRKLLRERRRKPSDDLLSRMISVREAGERLTDDEILANGVLLMAAGHETTVGLIGNGMKALLEHPAEARRLHLEPGLASRGVEELVRFDSPVQMTFRIAHEDVAIGSTTVRRGEAAALVIGSANRDPEAFPEPDRLDLSRAGSRHLAFGAGRHACLGSGVGRGEARAAFRAFARRLPDLDWDPAGATRADGVLFRVLSGLPVSMR